MNSLIPIAAAVLQASSFTLDKIILSLRRVGYKTYLGVSFPMLFFSAFILFLVFHPQLNPNLFEGRYAWMLAASIGITALSNILYYRALESDHLTELQTINLLRSVPIIVFSSIFFADERNPIFIFAALIAAGAIIWSHWERGRFTFARHTVPFLVWTACVVPVGIALLKLLLAVWDPVAFLFVHDGAIALVFWFLFSPAIRHAPRSAYGFLFLTNFLSMVAWVLFFVSYQRSGIVYTTLLFSLEPLIVYFAAVLFLQEKLETKKALAFCIVLATIVFANIS